MGYVDDGISKIASIRIKPRIDGFIDQYNRILLMKMCILTSIITGATYFSDRTNCIVANTNGMGGDFVGAACWIQGFYIYEEMINRVAESGYYGIPRNMDFDGINALGNLCSTQNRALDTVEGCEPLTKKFYLQYQYFPFYMAALGLFFYAPYMVFKTTNPDLKNLKDAIKANQPTEEIMANFFRRKVINKSGLRRRFIENLTVKIMYLAANLIAFIGTNNIVGGNFASYGLDYAAWSTLPQEEAMTHNLKERVMAKPANVLLPPIGFCDVFEATHDVRTTHINKHRLICEISPHILYQYLLMILWFLLVLGIILTIIGLLLFLLKPLTKIVFATGDDAVLGKALTLRELQYLDFIAKRKPTLLRDIKNELLNRFKKKEDDGISLDDMNNPVLPNDKLYPDTAHLM